MLRPKADDGVEEAIELGVGLAEPWLERTSVPWHRERLTWYLRTFDQAWKTWVARGVEAEAAMTESEIWRLRGARLRGVFFSLPLSTVEVV